MAEGVKLVGAALEAGAAVESVFVADGWRTSPAAVAVVEQATGAGVRVFELAPGVMEKVADAVTPQPVCAVVVVEDLTMAGFSAALGLGDPLAGDRPRPAADPLVVVCADVRDPGNLGAIVRVAGASGAAGVVACSGGVDPYNPKAIRASAGAVFHLPVVTSIDASGAIHALRSAGLRIWATVAHGGSPYDQVDLSGPTALVLGNEASGLPPDIVGMAGGAITVPVRAPTESLNVATTAAVLCFEVARRRRTAGSPAVDGSATP